MEVEREVYTVKRGDTVYKIAKSYGVPQNAIIKVNHIYDVRSLQPGQQLIIPGVKKASTHTPPPPASVSKSKGSFIWPVQGEVICYYGDDKGGLMNTGLDIRTEQGKDVVATRAGVVLTITEGLGGKVVVLKHQPGLNSWYGHVENVIVNEGRKVMQGQIIARMGKNNVLHFKVFVNDRPVDPLGYLP